MARPYGKINEKILIEGLARGLNYAEAGKLAGSKAKSIKNSVSEKINTNPHLKKDLISKLEVLQHKILDSIDTDEITRASLSQKSVSFGIFTEKSQLLKGDPTQRIAVMPKMVIDEIEAPVRGEIIEPKQIESGLK